MPTMIASAMEGSVRIMAGVLSLDTHTPVSVCQVIVGQLVSNTRVIYATELIRVLITENVSLRQH